MADDAVEVVVERVDGVEDGRGRSVDVGPQAQARQRKLDAVVQFAARVVVEHEPAHAMSTFITHRSSLEIATQAPRVIPRVFSRVSSVPGRNTGTKGEPNGVVKGFLGSGTQYRHQGCFRGFPRFRDAIQAPRVIPRAIPMVLSRVSSVPGHNTGTKGDLKGNSEGVVKGVLGSTGRDGVRTV